MTKRRKPTVTLSGWQKQAIAELKAIVGDQGDVLRISQKPTLRSDGMAVLKMRVATSEIATVPGGLPLEGVEEFVVGIAASPLIPPRVEVEHVRFSGFPHVLQGQRLCLYLDPSREWNPLGGIAAFLNRLWDWLTDAAGDKFDPSKAMYHAVGGVLHQAEGTPTVVVRTAGPPSRLQTAHLIERSPYRFDLCYGPSNGDHLRLPVITLHTALPYGASSTLATMLASIDDSYLRRFEHRQPKIQPQSPGLLTALAASAYRNPHDSAQYFVLAVPHPLGGALQLLCGRLPGSTANALRRVVAERGTAITIDPSEINPDIPVEWCHMSDERPEVTTRRDSNRPVNSFQDKRVHVWGCGGIGSWMAEFITRAGAAHITLCDPGAITGGHLVRQNYLEEDIGTTKAHALGRRLQSIRDDITVEVAEGLIPGDPQTVIADADIIIDATVSIAIGQYLDGLVTAHGRKAILAQVATDSLSGTLGMLTTVAPGTDMALTELDHKVGTYVTAAADLELYHSLWQEPLSGQELIPTRGCSVPTFHGSAADLAAIAASLVSLLGLQLSAPSSGTHLIALPHADHGPRHRFVSVGGLVP
ncbi:ThiF family adenylyltransferase [Kocuria turfanensis]|uniref:ThiF family adenylyltransferase n=1 Tax=Kocuria turfanensis TaxID=388357 RepID=UPI004035CA15